MDRKLSNSANSKIEMHDRQEYTLIQPNESYLRKDRYEERAAWCSWDIRSVSFEIHFDQAQSSSEEDSRVLASVQ